MVCALSALGLGRSVVTCVNDAGSEIHLSPTALASPLPAQVKLASSATSSPLSASASDLRTLVSMVGGLFPSGFAAWCFSGRALSKPAARFVEAFAAPASSSSAPGSDLWTPARVVGGSIVACPLGLLASFASGRAPSSATVRLLETWSLRILSSLSLSDCLNAYVSS
jgi:hypothetical protein